MDVQDFTSGFRRFIRENKNEDIRVSLYTFSSGVVGFLDNAHISEAAFYKTIISYGECRFLDSLGTILERTSDRINNLRGRAAPEKVVFVLFTESFLDTSNDYSLDEVNALITFQREDYFWEFVVFGAGLKNDMEEVGFLEEDVYKIDITEEGIDKAFSIVQQYYEDM